LITRPATGPQSLATVASRVAMWVLAVGANDSVKVEMDAYHESLVELCGLTRQVVEAKLPAA
jgi:hypothetical protein